MTAQEYLDRVKQRFTQLGVSNFHEANNTWIAYEGVFKWRWLATKLKIFSFVAYAETVDLQTMQMYSHNCFDYALKNRPGLPRGLQCAVVSNNVLVCNQATPDALAYAAARPDKHWSAFVSPVLVDLSNNALWYYREAIVWGMIYDGFLKRYVEEHFNVF